MKNIKILIIGPKHGGIGWYTKQLREHLSKIPFIKKADWRGYPFLTFDLKRIKKIQKNASSLNINKYDIVHLEFGTYDVEQVILSVLAKKKRARTKFVYTVHNTDWELSKKAKSRLLKYQLNKSLFNIDAFLFFGKQPFKILKNRFSFIKAQNSIISFHPSTFEGFKISPQDEIKILNKYKIKKPYLAIFGYPAKWKNFQLLFKAFSTIKIPIEFYFIGKRWKEKLKFSRKSIHKVKIRIIDKEVPPSHFFALIKNSLFGVFPYKSHLAFQCSGIVPIFINLGKAVVASRVGAIPDQVGKGGKLVNQYDFYKFGKEIERLVSNSKNRFNFEKKAKSQAIKLSWKQHVKKHLDLYRNLLKNE